MNYTLSRHLWMERRDGGDDLQISFAGHQITKRRKTYKLYGDGDHESKYKPTTIGPKEMVEWNQL